MDANGGLTNTYTDTSISAGVTYYYKVEATDMSGNGAPSNEAHAELGSPLSPPTDLEASVASDSEIDLNWTAPTSGSVSTYLIERDIYLDGWEWVAADYETSTGTSLIDTGLEAGLTYQYAVSAVDGANQSGPSNLVTVDIPCLPPASLTATSVGGQIRLNWPNDPNATSYWIFRGTTPGSESLLDSSGGSIINGQPLGANIAAVDEYNDVSAAPSVTYYYEVEAIDGGFNPSAPSPEAHAEIAAVPSAPTNLAATPVSDSQIHLTWTASSSSVSGYDIYCALGGSSQLIGTAVSTSFNATGLYASSDYTFYVASASAAGVGNYSSPAACYTLCAPPVVTAISSTGAITLTWLHDWNSTAYRVYRGTVASGETLFDSDQDDIVYFANSAPNETPYGGNTYDQYVDTTATPGVTYYYEIEAVNTDGNPSAPSNEVSVVGPAGDGNPPVNLVATAVSSSQINLTWDAPAGTVTSYQVYRSTPDDYGAFPPLQYVTTTTATTYSDTGLTANSAYKYAVVAVNGDVSRASSKTVIQYTLSDPPQGVTAAAANGEITVSWLNDWSASYVPYWNIFPLNYAILRGVTSGSETLYDENPADILYFAWHDSLGYPYDDFIDSDVTPGVTYYYEVVALTPAGAFSSPSSEVSATVPGVAGPTIATAASASPNPVTGTTTSLSVLGASTLGESSLTYAWSTTGTTPASVTYSANGTNSAKTTTATFTKAGTYNFQVTITDGQGGSVTSSVVVTVDQTLTTIDVSPSSPSISWGTSQQFYATENDQFGIALLDPLDINWSKASFLGRIDNSGVYTADYADYDDTIYATCGSITGSAALTTSIAAPSAAPVLYGAFYTNFGYPYVQLTFDFANGAQSYNLYKGSSSGGESSTPIATGLTAGDGAYYNDLAVVDGSTYYYTLRGVNSAGIGPASNEVVETIPEQPAPPVISFQSSLSTQFTLNCTVPAGTSYKTAYLFDSSGNYLDNASITYSGSSIVITALRPDTTYSVFATDVDSTGLESTPSNTLTVTTAPRPAPPVISLQSASSTEFTLNCTNAPGTSNKTAYVFDSEGNAANAVVTYSGSSILISELQPGTRYSVYATDVDGAGAESTPSNTLTVTTVSAPPLLYAWRNGSQVTLVWNSVPGATSYNVKTSSVTGGPYSTIASNVTTTTYSDPTVANNFYVVTSVSPSGESPNSNEAQPTTPFSLSATPSTVNLSGPGSAFSKIAVTSTGGFSGTITFSVTPSPDRISELLYPITTKLAPPNIFGDTTSNGTMLQLCAPALTTSGTSTLTVTATCGNYSASTTITLVVN
jgi:fibronectin type 3 domain-containing protein